MCKSRWTTWQVFEIEKDPTESEKTPLTPARNVNDSHPIIEKPENPE